MRSGLPTTAVWPERSFTPTSLGTRQYRPEQSSESLLSLAACREHHLEHRTWWEGALASQVAYPVTPQAPRGCDSQAWRGRGPLEGASCRLAVGLGHVLSYLPFCPPQSGSPGICVQRSLPPSPAGRWEHSTGEGAVRGSLTDRKPALNSQRPSQGESRANVTLQHRVPYKGLKKRARRVVAKRGSRAQRGCRFPLAPAPCGQRMGSQILL